MPFPRWQSLSDGAKIIWDTLSDDDKALILGNSTASPARASPGNRPGRPTRAQNDHSLDAAVITAYLHEFGIGTSGSDAAPAGGSLSHETDPLPTSDDPPTLAVHSTRKSWAKPKGDDLPP
jgi:hypothetical protein